MSNRILDITIGIFTYPCDNISQITLVKWAAVFFIGVTVPLHVILSQIKDFNVSRLAQYVTVFALNGGDKSSPFVCLSMPPSIHRLFHTNSLHPFIYTCRVILANLLYISLVGQCPILYSANPNSF